MAKYKGREVRILKEIPGSSDDQVMIEQVELQGMIEIVPKNQVVLTKEEKNAKEQEAKDKAKDADKTNPESNDYQVEGQEQPIPLQTTADVVQQKLVEKKEEENIPEVKEEPKKFWEKK